MPDEELRQFEQFYRQHFDALFAYASSRTSPDGAEEVVEETFLVAWRRFAEIPPRAPRPWLFGVARRVLANQRRSGERYQALSARVAGARAGSDHGPDPAEEVAGRDRALAALNRLEEADRDLLCLTAWGELAPEEVAKVLGRSKAAVVVRLHRARRRYQAALGAQDQEPGTDEPGHRRAIVNLITRDRLSLSKETLS